MEPGLGLRAVRFQNQGSSYSYTPNVVGDTALLPTSLLWFSNPGVLAFIRDRSSKACTPIHCKPCATSWLPWHLGNSRSLPVQSWVLCPYI